MVLIAHWKRKECLESFMFFLGGVGGNLEGGGGGRLGVNHDRDYGPKLPV